MLFGFLWVKCSHFNRNPQDWEFMQGNKLPHKNFCNGFKKLVTHIDSGHFCPQTFAKVTALLASLMYLCSVCFRPKCVVLFVMEVFLRLGFSSSPSPLNLGANNPEGGVSRAISKLISCKFRHCCPLLMLRGSDPCAVEQQATTQQMSRNDLLLVDTNCIYFLIVKNIYIFLSCTVSLI